MNSSVPKVQKPSLQSLFCQLRYNGQVLSTATGFVVNTRTGHAFLTNRHNVTGRNNETGELLSPTGGIPNEIVIAHHVAGRLGEWSGRVQPLISRHGGPLWSEHPTLREKADFVAIPLVNKEGIDTYPYDLTDEPKISVAPSDVVSVVGFPFGMSTGGLLAIWATGFIASEPQVKANNGLPIFYIDCRSRAGQSGSAVIAHRTGGMVAMEDGSAAVFSGSVTRLLGIYSGRINRESDIGIVWKTRAIEELVNSM